jgi:histidine triad (HIT) family protein
MAADPDCLFCKIVAGEIASDRVAESELSVAFRDITPQAPTHVLVVPRNHEPTLPQLADVDPAAAVDMLLLARRVAEEAGLVRDGSSADGSSADGSSADRPSGYRLVANNGAGAQQSVFHAHLHVLGGRSFTWPPG